MITLTGCFDRFRVEDLRDRPRYGYRAVHIIVTALDGKLVEIQARTKNQDLYAQLVEKAADNVDLAIKYGGGPDELQKELQVIGGLAASLDADAHALLKILDEAREIRKVAESGENRDGSPLSTEDHKNLRMTSADLDEKIAEVRLRSDEQVGSFQRFLENLLGRLSVI